MKINQEIVYRCDFCNKSMFGKGAMTRHEKYCKMNPNNAHKCFEFCRHLIKSSNYSIDEFGNNEGGTKFYCEIKKIYLYSFKFEKNTYKPVNALDRLTRMPLECEDHEYTDSYIINMN